MKQKKYIFGFVCLLAIFTLLMVGCQKKHETSSDITIRRHKFSSTWQSEDIDTQINANQSFFIATKNGVQSVVPPKYNLDIRIKGEYIFASDKHSMNRYQTQKNLDLLKLDVYDIRTRKLLKTIDLLPTLKKYDYQSSGNIEGNSTENGEDYTYIPVEPHPETNAKPQEEGDTFKFLKVNLETEETQVLSREELPDFSQNMSFDIQLLLGSNFLERNGFSEKKANVRVKYLDDFKNICRVRIKASALPKNNAKLYDEFPDLAKIRDRKDANKIDVYIYLTNHPDSMAVMSYLMEDGQQVTFDGVKINKDYTTDGKEHQVHSEEDLNQWYKYSEKNYEQYKKKK